MSDNPWVRDVIEWALDKQGLPYIWTAKGKLCWGPLMSEATSTNHGCDEAYDCSGLVTAAVHAVGTKNNKDLRFTWSAQNIWDELPQPALGEPGRLRLFGPTSKDIQHVAIEISPLYQLESAGGDHTTTHYLEALRHKAKVTTRDVRRGRKDLRGFRSLAAMQYL